MRSWWLLTAGLLGLAVIWLAAHGAPTARTVGDLIAVALVLLLLGLPWVGLILTARTTLGPERTERRRLSR